VIDARREKTRTNEDWVGDLRATGQRQAEALADLRAYLSRAAMYTFNRQRESLSHLGREEVRELAEEAAQEALLTILAHVDEFRGESKFTTWAYKFAINFAMPLARREGWKHVSLDQLLDKDDLPEMPLADETRASDPAHAALQNEIRDTIRQTMEQELTPRQRQVIQAIAFDEVPMDELVRVWGTNRNAIYKLLHDARRRLKRRLEERGFGTSEVMAMFSESK
jgi:RNA polymerase sigma-70 factor (ECF subfamily)